MTHIAPTSNIRQAVDRLLADHARQDDLSQADVDRVLAGHGIAWAESLPVYTLLSERGIEVLQAAEQRTPAARRRARQARRALAEEPALLSMLSHPRMSAQEEITLGRQIQQAQRMRADLDAQTVEDGPEARHVLRLGDEARERFVRLNLRLVLFVARRYYRPGGVSLADLLQEGVIGLMRAVQSFAHTRGARFSTYACWWIRQAITRSLDNKASTIRMPVHIAEAVRKLRRAERRLRFAGSVRPTIEQLAEELQWNIQQVAKILAVSQIGVVSLEAGWDEDKGDGSLLDTLPSSDPSPEEAAIQRSLVAMLHRTLAQLTDRQKLVVAKRFGLLDGNARTLEEIGSELGLTRERIRQIEAKALDRLRHPKHSKRLRVFAGMA